MQRNVCEKIIFLDSLKILKDLSLSTTMTTTAYSQKPLPAAAVAAIIDLTVDDEEEDDRKPSPQKMPAKVGFDSNIIDLTSPESRKGGVDVLVDVTNGGNAVANHRRPRPPSRKGRAEPVRSSRQEQEESDAKYAARMLRKEERNFKRQEEKDAKFAAKLSSEEEKQNKLRLEAIDKAAVAMKESPTGRAVLLVEAVITLLAPYAAKGIEPIGKDDAVYLAEKLIECQSNFKSQGKSPLVTIGYHYTPKQNLEAIRVDGLLTVEDRIAAKNKNVSNRAFFGNGVYSGTNPFAFTPYGDIGLMIAIIKGTEQHVGKTPSPQYALLPDTDTIVGNKTGKAPHHDEVIMRKSCQVLPLIQFDKQRIDARDADFTNTLQNVHEQLQKTLDEYLNTPTSAALPKIEPPKRIINLVGTIAYKPENLNAAEVPHRPVQPSHVLEECPICLDDMTENIVKLNVCRHRFHAACIQQVLSSAANPCCPVCVRSTMEPMGSCPPGTMTVYSVPKDCSGFPNDGSIKIYFVVTQNFEKPRHCGLEQQAYLPKNEAGLDLLKRVAYAFSRGLSFEVVTSYVFSTRLSSHHPSSTAATADSWATPGFMQLCNQELDALNVPEACALELSDQIKFY